LLNKGAVARKNNFVNLLGRIQAEAACEF